MTMTTTETGLSTLRLADLHESPLNPRKSFPADALAELTASIKTTGILVPLIVRPNAKGYEIAAGQRRCRAAKAAGLADVPALVRQMTDAEFIELGLVENDQRQDLTALEEADGYRLLMTRAQYTVERIAERIGMSEKYVHDRLRLLKLIGPVKDLLREGMITTTHAILLAQLTAKDQERAIEEDGGGLFEHEDLLWQHQEPGKRGAVKARSVRELQAWIDKHVRFIAAAADPVLFPTTVATVTAAKEQAEKVISITHEYVVHPDARDEKERIYSERSWKRADGQQKSKTCEHSITGVIVVGPGRGEAFKVCIAREKCETHWATEQREKAKRTTSTSGRSNKADRWKREEEKRRAEQAKAEAARERWTKATPAILEAVAAAVKKASTKASGLLAQTIVDAVCRHGGVPKAAVELVPRGKSADDLVRHAAFIVLCNQVGGWNAAAEFPKRAKAFGVDVAKILGQAAPVEAEKESETGSGAKGKSVKKRKAKAA
jgi:ParB family chromosome partitioning protein